MNSEGMPKQKQEKQPGVRHEMDPLPRDENPDYRPSDKLKGKVALITGGDSGIGRATAILFAKEGCDVAVAYLDEHQDARETFEKIEKIGQKCILLAGDVGDPDFCRNAVEKTVNELGKLDILINNAAEQHLCDSLLDISDEQMEKTFRTNIFSMFYLTKAALPHLKEGATIVNDTSIVAYQGHPKLIDYACTKGAILAFTRSLSSSLIGKGIRVNAVAPGPIWTPLIPASFTEEKTSKHGQSVPMQRPGEPYEVATCFLFLACEDSSYISGQTLHPNGGAVVNG
ncbi:NAD(P)-dependent dehydrogenase, short-chain alcohol dehydrogenase family [Desulfonatronum thiosulfatophilum]|uniref:NAD(P)-dependent dehydrogenase, short-chain alcohol dehydrogenase family n=1 Tax=Desulfonatronum thiosulfatophilum TaxID=617002 RepID=A0A1G6DK83_9BACT|nr:SDR family oxidoreductase [Desulfonatronum thiosulfatophilum]SDB45499.1 NAD(P)-dependent dehydrogenase, short-chain alcohol dehydrogenase family [Desulfonatronum thiosulfatophilum]